MSNLSILLPAFLDPINIEEAMSGNKILFGIRVVVAVVGAGLGWLLSGLIWRGLYWIFTKKAIPALMLVPLKLVSALAVAAAIFLFLPLGFGGLGGLGSGGGQGDGTGKGKGTGTESATGTKGADGTSDGKKKTGIERAGSEKIEITVLGGKDYGYKASGKFLFVHGEGKYYRVKLPGSEEATVMTLKEVDGLCEQRKNNFVVIVQRTGQSNDEACDHLDELLKGRHIERIDPNK